MSYCQVIFLPGWRQVSEEEMERREARQDELSLAHIEFDYANRSLSELERREKKELVHLRARQIIGIVQRSHSSSPL
jgi:hypothetical protein